MDDLIRRSDAIRVASGYCHWSNIPKELAKLPSVNPIPCEDAISRQAAIDAMATWDWQELYLPIHFKQLLEDLPSVSTEKTGWIPVSERLPEIGQRVLVIYNQEDKLKVDTTIFDRHGFLIGLVTAWMPLPQPYKEESEDKE